MHRITIESLAFGGYGITRIDKKVCFIPFGLPGDELLVEIREQKRGINWGKILEVYFPSPHRYDPICPVFESCGGCHWLHFDYNEQLSWKAKMVADALRRIAKISNSEIESITSGIMPLAYRTRAQFHFRCEDGNLKLGFHGQKSNTVVDLRICPLLHGGINDMIPYIRHIFENIEPMGSEGTIELTQNPINGETLIWLGLGDEDKDSAGELAAKLLEIDGVVAVDWENNPGDKVAFDIALGDIKAWVAPGSFSQSSFMNNEVMLDLVKALAGDINGKTIMDIYCGWGNLSLPLAAAGASVTGYDEDKDSIETANLSVSDNRIIACTYKTSTDKKLIKALYDYRGALDLIILDPPRTGAKVIAKAVAESQARRIIYVSCDPNTFARDIKIMADAGRTLRKTYVLDMIPQTYHIETVNYIE